MTKRVTVQWTTTAKDLLKKLPKKVRAGLLAKADELLECADPRRAHKPLVGPLQGFYRITCGRYRAIYTVKEEKIVKGDVLVHIIICFVAAGIRKEHDKKDVYQLAEKLVRLGLVDAPDADEGD